MGCNGCAFADIKKRGDGSSYIDSETLDGVNKLNTFDWLWDLPNNKGGKIIEVRFKNTRKRFYANKRALKLVKGDIVSVGAKSGHDVGVVSLAGQLAEKQYNRKIADQENYIMYDIFRKATQHDISIWNAAKEKEYPALLKAREIAVSLGLEMKISDLEYQGDGSRIIVSYISDNRVDFRELIKHYANQFNTKVEMRQIGVRQEAGMVGGLGSCGRELCCSTWRTDFEPVSMHAAKKQNLPPNVEKLLGQCGKLKCCLMYELDQYIMSKRDFPRELIELETTKGIAYPLKIDILQKLVFYAYKIEHPGGYVPLSVDKIKKAIDFNKRGKKIDLENF